jgi:hypothetical protein
MIKMKIILNTIDDGVKKYTELYSYIGFLDTILMKNEIIKARMKTDKKGIIEFWISFIES